MIIWQRGKKEKLRRKGDNKSMNSRLRKNTLILLVFIVMSISVVIAQTNIGEVDSDVAGVVIDSPEAVATFLGLRDTPNSYAGSGTLCLLVNAAENAVEFASCAVGGSNKAGDGVYLYNNTLTMFFNDTLLNRTIDNRVPTDTNASTCADGEYLDGSDVCLGFNVTVDDRINTLRAIYKPINAVNVTGIRDDGDFNSLRNLSDGDTYNLSEITGTPGFNIVINYTDVVEFANIQLHVFYDGSLGHTIDVELFNWGTTNYDDFGDISQSADFEIQDFAVADSTNYVSDGNVSLRLFHSSAGNPTHNIFLDYAVLQRVTQEIRDHGSLTGLVDDDHTQYLPIDGTRDMTGNLSFTEGLGIESTEPSTGRNLSLIFSPTAARMVLQSGSLFPTSLRLQSPNFPETRFIDFTTSNTSMGVTTTGLPFEFKPEDGRMFIDGPGVNNRIFLRSILGGAGDVVLSARSDGGLDLSTDTGGDFFFTEAIHYPGGVLGESIKLFGESEIELGVIRYFTDKAESSPYDFVVSGDYNALNNKQYLINISFINDSTTFSKIGCFFESGTVATNNCTFFSWSDDNGATFEETNVLTQAGFYILNNNTAFAFTCNLDDCNFTLGDTFTFNATTDPDKHFVVDTLNNKILSEISSWEFRGDVTLNTSTAVESKLVMYSPNNTQRIEIGANDGVSSIRTFGTHPLELKSVDGRVFLSEATNNSLVIRDEDGNDIIILARLDSLSINKSINVTGQVCDDNGCINGGGDTQKTTTEQPLYNDTDTIFFNNTFNNNTIDNRISLNPVLEDLSSAGEGAIVFVNGSNNLAGNSTELFWNESVNRMSIGGQSNLLQLDGFSFFSKQTVHCESNTELCPMMAFLYTDTVNFGTNFIGNRAGGNMKDPTVVVDGMDVIAMLGNVYNGSVHHQAAQILFEADGDTLGGSSPGRILFQTTPNGTSSLVERMRIANDGEVRILQNLNLSHNFTAGNNNLNTRHGEGVYVGIASELCADPSFGMTGSDLMVINDICTNSDLYVDDDLFVDDDADIDGTLNVAQTATFQSQIDANAAGTSIEADGDIITTGAGDNIVVQEGTFLGDHDCSVSGIPDSKGALLLGEGGDAKLCYNGTNTYLQNNMGSGAFVIFPNTEIPNDLTVGDEFGGSRQTIYLGNKKVTSTDSYLSRGGAAYSSSVGVLVTNTCGSVKAFRISASAECGTACTGRMQLRIGGSNVTEIQMTGGSGADWDEEQRFDRGDITFCPGGLPQESRFTCYWDHSGILNASFTVECETELQYD